MVVMIRHDLEFILNQILISEAHAAGADLTSLLPNPFLPWGLRTVDGSYNNLLAGQEQFGAADNLFPRALDPYFLNEADGDMMPLGPPGAPVVTNTLATLRAPPASAQALTTDRAASPTRSYRAVVRAAQSAWNQAGIAAISCQRPR